MEAAVRGSGTVNWISNVALSVGWLLDGNQLIEPGRLTGGEDHGLNVVPAELEELHTRVGDRLGRSRVAHFGDELGSRSEWIGRNDD